MTPVLLQVRTTSGGTGWTRLRSVLLASVLVLLGLAQAAPRIDHVDLLGTNLVTIHFDTEANRTYTLQYVDCLIIRTNGELSGAWTNLAVIPATPFNNHYVWPDFGTSSVRLYRLVVTP